MRPILIKLASLLALTVASMGASAQTPTPAQAPDHAHDLGLRLLFTDPIGGSNASQCAHPTVPPPNVVLSVTEADVVDWQADQGVLVLREDLQKPDAPRLTDRCFQLLIDGRHVAFGVVLASYSERLIRFPVLAQLANHPGLAFQLKLGHDAQAPKLLLASELDGVLGPPYNLPRQLNRLRDAHGQITDGIHFAPVGKQWSAAVQKLMDSGHLAPGTPLTQAVALLGPPTSSTELDGQTRYVWYFGTGLHVNPVLNATVVDGKVVKLALGRL